MRLSELDYTYPERLVATERKRPSRIMKAARREGFRPVELEGLPALAREFAPGDLLVINDTRVLKRRVHTENALEILFLNPIDETRTRWRVLCPSSRWKNGTRERAGGVEFALIERGRTQILEASRALDDAYFKEVGELPLPPYIQKARGERRNRGDDVEQYQTDWARVAGSLAAPTASLHFTERDLEALRGQGIQIAPLTLHVGLGTFLPITVDDLDQHVMHAESVEIPASTWRAVQETKKRGARVWALGTTVTRSLESAAIGRLPGDDENGFAGETDLFIRSGSEGRPGFEWRVVGGLLTNFHQPQSTLLALVGAFAGLDNVKHAYAWAIEREFRLFSYGDLSVWIND